MVETEYDCGYLDGPVEVRLLPSVVQKTSNSDPIGEVVNKRHIVYQVMSLSNAQDENGGCTLRNRKESRACKRERERETEREKKRVIKLTSML